jgi:UDP-3-O-[3-hydroxymyristoyl] N-acetylglucosamine deacetylase / 3-hydroxyacyl-[acyl-carrier-protein] dehydratase
MRQQQTIKSPVTLSGAGLHTGEKVSVTLCPAPENAGIVFKRIDLAPPSVLLVSMPVVLQSPNQPRCTTIGHGPGAVHTIEHLMSALAGLGITNLEIQVSGREIPGMDGSAKAFAEAILKNGIVPQNVPAEPFTLQEPVVLEHQGASIAAFPANELKISYILDYPHPKLRSQFLECVITPETFIRDIAPARTFCLASEVDELRRNNMGLGADYTNTLVVADNGPVKNTLRFDNEYVRHKILDCVGDLYLLGFPVNAHIYAVKSGHYLNRLLVEKIFQQRQAYEKKRSLHYYDVQGKTELTISDIMKILPHRYPFLFVDRIYNLEKGKKATGIKNVTLNDYYFQGHFPTRPVLPGVVMVEAMAQTAGVVVLTNENHRGKVAFFMSIDKAKFRKVVNPGDQVVMDVEVVRDKSRFVQVRGVAKVGGEVAAEADMVFSFVETNFLNY